MVGCKCGNIQLRGTVDKSLCLLVQNENYFKLIHESERRIKHANLVHQQTEQDLEQWTCLSCQTLLLLKRNEEWYILESPQKLRFEQDVSSILGIHLPSTSLSNQSMIPYYQSLYQRYKNRQEELVQEKIQQFIQECEVELSKTLQDAFKDCLLASSLVVKEPQKALPVIDTQTDTPQQVLSFSQDNDVFDLDGFEKMTEKYLRSEEEDFIIEPHRHILETPIHLSTSLPISIPQFGDFLANESHEDEFVAPHLLSAKTYAGDPLKHLRPTKTSRPE